MTYILAQNLTKSVPSKVLFDSVNFAINPTDKIAIVAQNGTGKTTLLNVLAQKEQADSGEIIYQKGIRLAYLAQNPELNPSNTVSSEIFNANSTLLNIVRNYEEALASGDDKAMQTAFEAMSQANAWEYEAKVHEILANLKLDDLNALVGKLSGGQKKRLALAKILIDEADVLVMDEPTNHLDLEMVDWLEEFLAEEGKAIILVTHDRYFLDRVCNQILELENGKIYKHKGNYEEYLEAKETRHEIENTNIDKTNQQLKKELEWVKKSPKGRLAKSTARVDAYHLKAENVGQKHVTTKVKLDVISSRMGTKVLELHNIDKSFGNKVILSKFGYKFRRGEKLGIIGHNGVGKSTFLNIIMGLEPVDAGNIVQGETITFGYYSQHQSELNDSMKVIDAVKEIAMFIKLSDGSELSASKLLERFLFTPKTQQNLIGKLSGGEKKRLSLLRILMLNPNFLILDEPTNDFDLQTLEVLQEFLVNFAGCLIIISHDRYFIDSIVDHLFIFKGNGEIKDFPGNYTDYRNSTVEAAELTPPEAKPANTANNAAHKLLEEITKLEKKKQKLEESLYNMSPDKGDFTQIQKQIEQLVVDINSKTQKWIDLTEE